MPLTARRQARHLLRYAGTVVLGGIITLWSLLPVYNMFMIALDPSGHDEFSGAVFPSHPTLRPLLAVVAGTAGDVRGIWQEFGNSILLGLAVVAVTIMIGSPAAFAIGRMRARWRTIMIFASLAVYTVPISTLAIPLGRIMQGYGLSNTLWAVILGELALTTPAAVVMLVYAERLVPRELYEAARIDGASAVYLYLWIYLPLTTPALAIISLYSLLFSWNDYYYQSMLVIAPRDATVAVVLGTAISEKFTSWNYMMAVGILYSLLPIAAFLALRWYMVPRPTTGPAPGHA